MPKTAPNQVAAFNWAAFVSAHRGKRILHLGHFNADCDAIGSAWAMACVLGGDVGCAAEANVAASDLAYGLGFHISIDPNPADYDAVILYDIPNTYMLGMPLPPRYTLFDHHEPGGHVYSSMRSELAEAATMALAAPFESTCSLLAELFRHNNVPITRDMALALAAGLITDTGMLAHASGDAVQRLGRILTAGNIRYEDVLAVLDTPYRRQQHHEAAFSAMRSAEARRIGPWQTIATVVNNRDDAHFVSGMLHRIGARVRIVAFPHRDNGIPHNMVQTDCDVALVDETSIDLGTIARAVAAALPDAGANAWGTPVGGRLVASLSTVELLRRMQAAVVLALTRAYQVE